MPGQHLLQLGRFRLLICLAGVLLAAVPAGVEAGAPQAAEAAPPRATPWLAAASGRQCVMTRQRGGRQTLVNTCRECRSVSLQHRRPGGGFPVARTYSVPSRSEIQLSFRGPGVTRIVSDRPCNDKSASSDADVQRDCAHLLKRRSGNLLLVNACTQCRAVSIERLASNGQSQRQVFALTARSHITLKPQGAAQIRIVTDRDCR